MRGGGSSGAGASAATLDAGLDGASIQTLKLVGKKGLGLRCSADRAATCTVSASLQPADARRLGLSKSKTKPYVLGKATVKLKKAGAAVVTVRLARRALSRLKRAPRVTVLVTGKAVDGGGRPGRAAPRHPHSPVVHRSSRAPPRSAIRPRRPPGPPPRPGARRLHGVVTDLTSTPSRSLADERGSLLIEVLVSAVLVAVIGVALFGALNSAAQVSGKSKTRAGAAAVAQDDQERMRAMPVATLNNLREHRDPVVMGKIAYVVDSRAEWIADAKGATDCTANGAAADYLKITSTVSAKNIPLKPDRRHEHRHPGARAPSRATRAASRCRSSAPTAPAAPASTCRSTAPPATSSSPTPTAAPSSATSPSATTTSPPARSGYVDPNGNATATGTSSVGSQTVATLSLSYDQAGQATANFVTRPRRHRPEIDSNQGSVGFSNAGVTINSGVRYFANWHAGDGDHDDADAVPVPGRLQRVRGRLRQQRGPHRGHARRRSRSCPASSTTRSRSTCRRSTSSRRSTASTSPGMYVRIKSTTAGCTPKTYPARTSNANFRLDDPGFPFGTYSVCVDNRFQASLATARSVTSTVTLNALSAGGEACSTC